MDQLINALMSGKFQVSTRHVLVAAILTIGTSTSVRAFDTLSVDRLNYSFATYLGTGIYKAGDQNVQVYQIPLSYQLQAVDAENYGIKINVPLTIGYFGIDTSDIIDDGLPDNVSTYSIVPGIEFTVPVSLNWQLSPFADYGFSTNNENGETYTIYSYGLKSRYNFSIDQYQLILGNNLLYAKQESDDGSNDSDFASFETGLDFRLPEFKIFNAHLADFSFYYVNFRYFDNLEFLRPANRPVDVTIQHEIGFTFGVKLQEKYRYLDIPRIGLGYRKGDGLSVFRIVLGMPF